MEEWQIGDVVRFMSDNKAVEGFIRDIHGVVSLEEEDFGFIIGIEYAAAALDSPLCSQRYISDKLFKSKKELLKSL